MALTLLPAPHAEVRPFLVEDNIPPAQGSAGEYVREQLAEALRQWKMPASRSPRFVEDEELEFNHVSFPVVRTVRVKIGKIEPMRPRNFTIDLDEL